MRDSSNTINTLWLLLLDIDIDIYSEEQRQRTVDIGNRFIVDSKIVNHRQCNHNLASKPGKMNEEQQKKEKRVEGGWHRRVFWPFNYLLMRLLISLPLSRSHSLARLHVAKLCMWKFNDAVSLSQNCFPPILGRPRAQKFVFETKSIYASHYRCNAR